MGHRAARRDVHVERADDGAVVSVAVLERTRVDVVLAGRTAMRLPDGMVDVTEVRLYADDPRAFVAAAEAVMRRRRAAA